MIFASDLDTWVDYLPHLPRCRDLTKLVLQCRDGTVCSTEPVLPVQRWGRVGVKMGLFVPQSFGEIIHVHSFQKKVSSFNLHVVYFGSHKILKFKKKENNKE